MNCDEIRELLSLYIDNKLEEEQMIEIERHLLVCDACKKEFEGIVLVINAMKNLPEVEIPAQFDSGLREELKKAAESSRKTDKKNKRIRYSSIAAIFLIGIFSFAMYNINIQQKTTSATGDISYETISYRGQDGKLWKIE